MDARLAASLLLLLPDELVTRVAWHASPRLRSLAATCRHVALLTRALIRSPSWRCRLCNAKALLTAGVWSGGARWTATPRSLPSHPDNERTRFFCVSSPDERVAATAGEREVIVWSRGLHRLATILPSPDAEPLCISVRGTKVAIATSYEDVAVRVWDLDTLDADVEHPEYVPPVQTWRG